MSNIRYTQGQYWKFTILAFFVISFLFGAKNANAALILNHPNYFELGNGLVGYWSFDGKDMAGVTAYDRSGNSNNGTLTNMSDSANGGRIVGKLGQALSFDGVDDALNLGAFSPSGTTWTFSFWVNFPSANTGYIFDSSSGRLVVAIGNFCGLNFCFYDGAWKSVGSPPSANQWHNIALVLNGSNNTATGYIDGTQSGTNTYTPTGIGAGTCIGQYHDCLLGTTYKGVLDEVRIYNRALSADEIKRLYRIGATLHVNTQINNDTLTNGLVGWWSFDGKDMAGVTAYDRSGVANNNTSVLGTNSILSNDDSGNGNLLVAIEKTLSTAGTAQSISFYVNTASGNLIFGIYDNTGPNGGPGAKLAETAAFAPTTGWNAVNLVSPVNLSAGTYWLAYSPSSSGLHNAALFTGIYNIKYYSRTYDGTLPGTFSISPSSTTGDWSFYASISITTYGNNGTLTNGPTKVAGKLGQALSFDGVNDEVDIVASNSLNNLSAISISAWINPSSITDLGALIAKNSGVPNSMNSGWTLRMSGTSKLNFSSHFNSTALFVSSNTNSIGTNSWQYITVTWDGSTSATNVHFYVNGVEIGHSSDTNGVGTRADDSSVGLSFAAGANQLNYTGKFDDVRVYNRVLSQAEITRLYKIGATLHVNTQINNDTLTNGLVGWWSFDGSTISWANNKVMDMSGQNNIGQLIKMSTSTSPIAGKLGQALSFDGVDDGLSLGAFSPSGTTWTFSFWTKRDAADNGYVFDSNIGRLVIDFGLNCTANHFCFYDGAWKDMGAVSINGAWHHLVLVLSGTSATSYLDGAQLATGSYTATGIGSRSCIGNHNSCDASVSYKGVLDDFRIYNRALSQAEITRIYNLGK